MRGLNLFCSGSIFCLSVLMYGCAVSEYSLATKRSDIILYPVEKELQIGDKLAKAFLKKFPPVEDLFIQDRINSIGKRVAAASDRTDISYKFKVVEFPGKNAVSLPGGYVFISRELVDFCRTDDELASVLAHEVGHIAAKHSLKRLQASYTAMALSLGAAASGNKDLERAIGLGLNSLFSAYSQEDEFLADKLAVVYMRRAGFNPEAMLSLFKRLDQEERYHSPRRPVPYFRTHPYLTQRVARIRELLGDSAYGGFLDYINRQRD